MQRVAREVGTEGNSAPRCRAADLKDLLTLESRWLVTHRQVRNIAEVATAIAGGDLSRKITVDAAKSFS